MYLIPGVLGFIACCLFDINKIKWQSKKLNIFFILGTLLILFSTVHCVWLSDLKVLMWPWSINQILGVIGFIVSGIWLVYALFFALPFEDTYMESDEIPVIDHGLYGACRHPGFWFLALVYLFLYIIFGSISLKLAFITYTICNFLYIYVQDRYIFPKYIRGYDEYKKSVPFLVPRFRR